MKSPFIAKRLRSNVRELEGALNRVVANVSLTGRAITIDFVREALRDLVQRRERLVTIDNIQKTVAEYYNIKLADIFVKTPQSLSGSSKAVGYGVSERIDEP